MTLTQALNIARALKFGPLPKPGDPMPSIEEAIGLIHEERKICGFTWLTGEAAEKALQSEKEAQK